MANDSPDWDHIKRSIPMGTQVAGTVVARHPYGVFVDIGVGVDGLLLVTRFAPADEPAKADGFKGYPSVGDRVSARVIVLDDTGHRIALTQRDDDR